MAVRACLGAAGVSGRAVCACFGVARALKMQVRDPPKQCYLPHRSHLALEMAARACLGAAGVSGRAVWACFGVARALKMAAQSRQCSHLALEIASQACPGAGGAPGRPIGPVLALPGCSKWPLKAASVLEKAASACLSIATHDKPPEERSCLQGRLFISSTTLCAWICTGPR